jgi:VIT1/CCC1 family predicted Fe2+/Mn2+ transporter
MIRLNLNLFAKRTAPLTLLSRTFTKNNKSFQTTLYKNQFQHQTNQKFYSTNLKQPVTKRVQKGSVIIGISATIGVMVVPLTFSLIVALFAMAWAAIVVTFAFGLVAIIGSALLLGGIIFGVPTFLLYSDMKMIGQDGLIRWQRVRHCQV